MTGLKDHRAVGREINRIFSKSIIQQVRCPTNIFDQDWDNIILLDGCRFDLFNNTFNIGSEDEFIWSQGSHTIEFLEKSLPEGGLDDVVWISANPQVTKFDEQIFNVINLWKSDWNNELETVLPGSVVKAAEEAERDYPNKRLVIHFLQPHYPFVGDIGRNKLPDHSTVTTDDDGRDSKKRIWELLKTDDSLSNDLVWKAYRENLEIVKSSVLDLGEYVSGKTIVSADHGNMLGERCFPIPLREYGHPRALYYKPLIKVPWVTLSYDSRKEIIASDSIPATSSSEEIDSEVKDRLEKLGYK
jgi:hypothetical protein